MTSSNTPVSIGTKLAYAVIILLWLSAAAAVYVTFFAPEADRPVRLGEQHVPDSAGQKQRSPTSDSEANAPEPEEIVLNAEGKIVDPDSEEFKLPRKLPEFELVNQSNEKVSLESLKGKPWVATFVFSKCPGPCPLITGRMRVLQQDMKRFDIQLVSITVDPERDTPEILTKYADAFSADLKNWNFLTGDRAAIYSLIRNGFKMPVGETRPGDVLHTNRFVVVDAEGNYVESYLAMNDDEFARMKKHLRELATTGTNQEESKESSETAETLQPEGE